MGISRNTAAMLVASLLLSAGAAAQSPAPVATPASTDPMQETVCRKSPETGSLVKVRKRCHTRAQWQYIDEETQRQSNRFVEDNRGRPSLNN